MAVYTRGYRTYSGGFHGVPGWWTILREGYRIAWRSKGFRFVGMLVLVWFVIWGAVLYGTLGAKEKSRKMGIPAPQQQQLDRTFAPENQLKNTLAVFYGGVSALSGLLALLLGAGLISDDLRTRALPLYLVRPIHASDYVLGKALVLPAILLWICLLPGLIYYLLVGLWQPPGETGPFLRGNLDIVHLVVQQYLIAAGSYTGLMLFLSSRSPRRGAVMGFAAAILFVGSMLAAMSMHLRGTLGTAFRYLGIPWSYEAGFAVAAAEVTMKNERRLARIQERMPDMDIALWIALGLLFLGLWSVYRRARTVEITS